MSQTTDNQPTTRLMEGVWDLQFTPEIPDDFAFGHGSGFWNDCYRQFVYSTDGYPDQAERVGPTDRIAIGVVHQDGDTVHGRDWDGRAVILVRRPVAFVVGQTYECRSMADYDCRWRYTVTARTAKTVTLLEEGDGHTRRRKVSTWRGVETCMPHGRYSLAAILSADKVVTVDA